MQTSCKVIASTEFCQPHTRGFCVVSNTSGALFANSFSFKTCVCEQLRH